MKGILFILELPSEVKNVFKRLEQINKKEVNSSLLFNKTLLFNVIQPKYANTI